MSTAPRRTGALLPAPRPRCRDGVYRICCVCTGNICRSPMAEIMLADKLARADLTERVVVDSAGTSDEEDGRPAYPGTERALRRHGLDPVSHRARVFEPDWITGYDLVLAMAVGHARVMRSYISRYGGDAGRVLLLGDLAPEPSGDVPDPWGHDDTVFEAVYQQLDPALDAVVAALPDVLPPAS